MKNETRLILVDESTIGSQLAAYYHVICRLPLPIPSHKPYPHSAPFAYPDNPSVKFQILF